MYSQIFIARNETFPSLPSSVSSHQATATTNRTLGILSLHPCDCANITQGESSWSLIIPWGRALSLHLVGGVDPICSFPKEARIHMPVVRIIPRAFQGPMLIAPVESTLKTWLQDQDDGKGLAQGFANCSTEQPMMQFVFCTQKGSKASHRAPCKTLLSTIATILNTICSPTLHISGRK